MKMRLEDILFRIHFVVLTIAIMNAFFKSLTSYSFESSIEFGVEMLTVISGLALFFFYLKPFRRINFYFSIYPTIGMFLIIGLMFRGLFWGLVLSVILFPLMPDKREYEEDGIIISTSFQGIMAPCCTCKIKKRKLLFFVKNYGEWSLEGEGPIDFERLEIEYNDKGFEIIYPLDYDKSVIKKQIR